MNRTRGKRLLIAALTISLICSLFTGQTLASADDFSNIYRAIESITDAESCTQTVNQGNAADVAAAYKAYTALPAAEQEKISSDADFANKFAAAYRRALVFVSGVFTYDAEKDAALRPYLATYEATDNYGYAGHITIPTATHGTAMPEVYVTQAITNPDLNSSTRKSIRNYYLSADVEVADASVNMSPQDGYTDVNKEFERAVTSLEVNTFTDTATNQVHYGRNADTPNNNRMLVNNKVIKSPNIISFNTSSPVVGTVDDGVYQPNPYTIKVQFRQTKSSGENYVPYIAFVQGDYSKELTGVAGNVSGTSTPKEAVYCYTEDMIEKEFLLTLNDFDNHDRNQSKDHLAKLLSVTVVYNEIVQENAIRMTNGASVRLAEPSGIRFESTIDMDLYRALCGIQTAEVTAGTLIIPDDDQKLTGETFTIAALEGDGKFAGTGYLDIPLRYWQDEYGRFTGVMTNVKTQNYTRRFAARGYLKVAYEDGSYDIYYSDFDPDAHVRTIADVARKALEDPQQSYTEEERKILEQYCGKVS